MILISIVTRIGEVEMNPFVAFMSSSAGRIVRIVAGIGLIAVGLLSVQGTTGIVIAVVGLVPLVAGLFDFCVFAPLFGAPLSGAKVRATK
jgi:hypothetical protein